MAAVLDLDPVLLATAAKIADMVKAGARFGSRAPFSFTGEGVMLVQVGLMDAWSLTDLHGV
jgi:hypothetical protein